MALLAYSAIHKVTPITLIPLSVMKLHGQHSKADVLCSSNDSTFCEYLYPFKSPCGILDPRLVSADCEDCRLTMDEECPEHPLVVIENADEEMKSLMGEPECVALYKSRVDPSRVGAFALEPVPRNARFGPLSEEAEEAGTVVNISKSDRSAWMLVSVT